MFLVIFLAISLRESIFLFTFALGYKMMIVHPGGQTVRCPRIRRSIFLCPENSYIHTKIWRLPFRKILSSSESIIL